MAPHVTDNIFVLFEQLTNLTRFLRFNLPRTRDSYGNPSPIGAFFRERAPIRAGNFPDMFFFPRPSTRKFAGFVCIFLSDRPHTVSHYRAVVLAIPACLSNFRRQYPLLHRAVPEIDIDHGAAPRWLFVFSAIGAFFNAGDLQCELS